MEKIKNKQETQVVRGTFTFSAHRSWRTAAARLPRRHPWCPCAQACASCAVLTMAPALPFLSSSSRCGPRRGFRMAGKSYRSGTGHTWLPWRKHLGSVGPAGNLGALCSTDEAGQRIPQTHRACALCGEPSVGKAC